MSNATGSQSDARFETSAARAETESSTIKLANQVEINAENLHQAAGDAAKKAQHTSPAAAVDQLEKDLSEKTDAAAAEGQANARGYVEQAKNLANSVLSTAQSYLPASVSQPTNGPTATGTTTEKSQTGVDTAKEYLTQAQNAAAPVAQSALAAGVQAVQTAKTTAVPYLQGAADSLSRTIAGASAKQGSTDVTTPAEIPPKTASLESGEHVAGTPYPQAVTTTGQSTKVAQL